MTRTIAGVILFTVAQLAILPGCRHFPHSQQPASNPKKIYDAASEIQGPAERMPRAKALEITPPSISSDNSREIKIETKLPLGPRLPDSVIGRPTALFKLENKGKPDEPAKPVIIGATALTSIEHEPPVKQASEPQSPIMPVQATDGKRDHVALLRALELMITDRPREAIKYLQIYDKDTQEIFLRLLPPLTLFVKKSLDEMSPQEIAIIDQQLQGFLQKIRPRSELQIARMCYCKRIRAFGAYDALPNNHTFLTGVENRPGELVQLYVELKNFVSEPTKDDDYVTKLSCTIELHDNNNRKVWSHSFDRQETTHRRATRLTDFYSNYSFYVPNLPAGTYQLTVQIVDETLPEFRRIARRSLDFRASPIAGQPGLR